MKWALAFVEERFVQRGLVVFVMESGVDAMYSSNNSFAFSRCSRGSHVDSSLEYPFHLTRYSFFPFLILSPLIDSTSHSGIIPLSPDST